MKNWSRILIRDDVPLLQAIHTIDETALQIALIVDEDEKLLGTVTDGDVRRAILRGIRMDAPVREVMNTSPTVAKRGMNPQQILSLMQQKSLLHIPILNEDNRVIGLERMATFMNPRRRDNIVVLMAGGLGTRLRPLTDECPKPLLQVGQKPILETIIESFIQFGFHRFYISINYKGDMIQRYFEDGSKWGVSIQYVHEKDRLGTAGALSLLPEVPSESCFVMNGDLLTKVNFDQLLHFHELHGSKATMCIREYDFQVPYGVVNIDDYRLLSIEEKPVQRFFVSAGIYVLSPELISLVPRDTYFDMPSLFQKAIDFQLMTSVFPIREYWLDIGRIGDYERANIEYLENF